MKKLLLSILGLATTFGVVAFQAKPIITAQAALTEPTGYEWKYKPVNIYGDYSWFSQSVGQAGYQIGYTRTADGSYSNYVATIDDTTGLPQGISIELSFKHSNTSWDYNGVEYYPISQYIGSDNSVGTLSKYDIFINNLSNKNYMLTFDRSSSGQADYVYLRYPSINSSYIYGGIYQAILLGYNYNEENCFLIPSYTSVRLSDTAKSRNEYLDAIYLHDLGLSAAYTNGYSVGEDTGYDIGYDNGNYDGQVEGYQDGYEFGYLDGFGDGNDEGQALTGLFSILTGAVSAISGIFSLELFPNLTLGGLLMIPLLISIFVFFKKMSRSN